MAPSLTLSSSTPAGRAATLINEVYGQYVPDLTVQQGDKVSLSTGSSEVTSLADVASQLFEAAGKANDALGASEEQRTQAKTWLKKVEELNVEKPEELKARPLTPFTVLGTTYVAGDTFTAGDLGVFAAVHPYMAQASHSTLLSHPALTRHFDHIQHLPLVSTALARSSTFSPSVVSIDTNNVPVVEIKPDAKVKKPRADAAGAPAPAEVKQAPVEKIKSDKVKGEQKVKAVAAPGEGEKKPKGEKKEKAPKEKKPAAPAAVAEAPAPWMIDLRVGKIVDVKVHPDADSLYVEQIDVGEAEPRTVVSGLVKYKTLDEMRNATLITVCNLKPASMRGVKSFAMVLCATSPDGKDGGVEFVNPPAGSQPGDRVYFEGFADKQPLDLLNPKKKIFESVQPGFTTLENKDAAWVDKESGKVYKIVTDKGVCAAPNFVGASLS
ncbi:tRNA binding protein [Rhodotorula toruloides]|uniref:tRNA binding protein n=1 Tax=Rhodotorula toruloides TaxID=5286 RepID=A0A511KAC0_RHOTO|nr:tRNA binding protein [Rhodotorula toruloides]